MHSEESRVCRAATLAEVITQNLLKDQIYEKKRLLFRACFVERRLARDASGGRHLLSDHLFC
jgi:hypothetical protein